ncbi:2-oxoacid:acceptor oxidoreductase subunit alpha [bacterium]|nr:2-oxoacid:acceptor oxidoreductase subunit alpha [bacterium]
MIKKKDISIVLCGPAGRGIQTAEKLLVSIFRKAGYHIFATKEYMSRVRGGSNSITIRVSSESVKALVDRIDILIPLDRIALGHVEHRISEETLVIGEKDILLNPDYKLPCPIMDVPLTRLSKETGGIIYSNVIVTGLVARLFNIEKSVVQSHIKQAFGHKDKKIVGRNIDAVSRGFDAGKQMEPDLRIELRTRTMSEIKNEFLINGGEAVSLGAIAGGCRFIASYPMTPSTPVLTFLARHAEHFQIIAEQTEDEIAAINMALGASYAGVRSMVTTSGGGFALMTEGLSLAGMIETPIVIHLAQRPGPATGLPTRTEQGDLLFALYAGHGEFPRVILAPGSLEDGFLLTRKAFELADNYQIPVLVLTDQYYIDSYYNLYRLQTEKSKNRATVMKTDRKYKRFALSKDGISPRGIPGYGDGFVEVDSDEHDEEGHITESSTVRINMVEKRLKKVEALAKEALPPEWIGPKDCETLVVCWGSTVHIVTEAVRHVNQEKMAVLYFRQVYPISPEVQDYFKKPKQMILVENNATAQFGRILKSECDLEIPKKILKYSGLAFSVEEITRQLQDIVA